MPAASLDANRDFPAGTGAELDPRKEGSAKTKAALRPDFFFFFNFYFSKPPSTACPLDAESSAFEAVSPADLSRGSTAQRLPWGSLLGRTAEPPRGRAGSALPTPAAKLAAPGSCLPAPPGTRRHLKACFIG